MQIITLRFIAPTIAGALGGPLVGRSDRALRVPLPLIVLASAQRYRPSGVLEQFDWDNCAMAITNPQLLLSTAGGRIRCARCTAQSSRTKLQCGRPALKTSKTQVCQFHGGRGSGPNTEPGRSRIAAAHYKHGESTKAARAEYSRASATLSKLEDAMYFFLKMTTAPRTRGRKPSGYKPVRSIQDVVQMVLDMEKH